MYRRVEEPYWEMERILRWRWIKKGNKQMKEYSILWKNFSIDEASWVTQAQFIQPRLLTKFIKDDQPVEEK